MHAQRNVSQKRLCLVVLLMTFLLVAVGCGAPQSSPKAIAKAYLDTVNARRCGSFATLFYQPAESDVRDAFVKELIADCERYGDVEIDMAHLDVSEGAVRYASPADKANGFGDRLVVNVRFALRQRSCSDCRWEDRSCTLDLLQYKSKWWIANSNCLVFTPSLWNPPGGGMIWVP